MDPNGNGVYVTDLGFAEQLLPRETPPDSFALQNGLLGTAYFATVSGHRDISKRKQSCPLIGKPLRTIL